MTLTRYWSWSAAGALAALLASAALALDQLRRAIALDPLPIARSGSTDEASAAATDLASEPAIAAASKQAIAATVEHDLFRPDRHRPPQRFRLPGEGAPAQGTAPRDPAAVFALVGTAVLGEGKGFAMCQRTGETPRLVRIGERFGEFTLRTVEQGRAVFRTKDGSTMELRVAKAGT
jgi:hypothetical protein